jgi:hypothetical protein
MKITCLFLLLTAIGISVSSPCGSAELLIELNSDELPALMSVLGEDYRLYALLSEACLAGVDAERTALLDARGIRYSVITRDMRPGAYYLVTHHPRADGRSLNLPRDFLYREGDVALVEADREEAELLSQMGFELVCLMPLATRTRPEVRQGSLLLRKRNGDGLVDRLVAEVSSDSLDAYVRALEGFQTRYSYTDSCWSAGQWILDIFLSFGIDATFHEYDWGAEHWRNVVGTIQGKSDSTVIVVICGHFDSISEDPWNLAPGAEDNASGTAVVIEAARVLSEEEHDLTLRFIAFSGEEQGLIGSYHYVTEAFSRGDNIVAAMNFDMVGYTDDEHYDISVRYDSNSIWLGNLITAAARFSCAEPYSFLYSSPSSDHWHFQQYGYPATFSIHISRTHGYPHYHSVNDTAGSLNYQFLSEVTRMAVASMAIVGNGYPSPPLPPDHVEAMDTGTGGAIWVGWNPSVSPGVLGYNIYFGESPRKYGPPVYAGSATEMFIGGLENNRRYYLAVTSIDDDSEGGYSVERSAVSREIPVAPESLCSMPIYLGIDLFWKPNSELDLAGYNVHRSTASGGPYLKINPSLVLDTVYSDSGLMSGQDYFYVVTAVDTTDLESGYSEETSSLPFSFDRGIIVVDETRDGTGGTLLPDSLQDDFYGRLLSRYEFDSWDFDSSGPPAISTLGLYSTIIWRSEDIYEHHISSCLEDVSHYLRHGGNLWLIGWKAVAGLMPVGEYPFVFVPGDWPHDYLHLSGSDNTGTVGLVRVEGANGYPDALVDSSKAPAGWNGSVYLTDTAAPLDSEVLLRFHSDGTDTTFEGEPVATRYIGADYRTVFFGFPLYYLTDSGAQALVDAVLADLGEPKGVEEYVRATPAVPGPFLFQNSPNPFSASTSIRVISPRGPRPEVVIYDAAGRQVRTLRLLKRGSVTYDAEWSGETDRGELLPSGTYFYRLSNGSSPTTRKLILVR